jgi:phospholipid transport system transporter-binding protein
VNRTQAVLELQAADGGEVCRLTGPLDFSTVPDLAREIPGLFARSRQLTVDLAGVTRVDSAAMALLLEMHRLAATTDSTLSLQHVPVALRNIIHISELDPILPAAD